MVKITRETQSAEELYALARRTKDCEHALRLRAVAMVLEGFRRDLTARAGRGPADPGGRGAAL